MWEGCDGSFEPEVSLVLMLKLMHKSHSQLTSRVVGRGRPWWIRKKKKKKTTTNTVVAGILVFGFDVGRSNLSDNVFVFLSNFGRQDKELPDFHFWGIGSVRGAIHDMRPVLSRGYSERGGQHMGMASSPCPTLFLPLPPSLPPATNPTNSQGSEARLIVPRLRIRFSSLLYNAGKMRTLSMSRLVPRSGILKVAQYEPHETANPITTGASILIVYRTEVCNVVQFAAVVEHFEKNKARRRLSAWPGKGGEWHRAR